MSFGNWPPIAPPQYARIDQSGTILFQTKPPFLDSVTNPALGEYPLQFASGQFDQNTQSIFVTPADGAAPGGRPNVEVGTGDSGVVFMTDDTGANIAQSFYLQLVKRVA